MGGDDHIRIGNPKVSIDGQVFILSDAINPGCDELLFNQIIIEGNVPVIRSREGVKLTPSTTFDMGPRLSWRFSD